MKKYFRKLIAPVISVSMLLQSASPYAIKSSAAEQMAVQGIAVDAATFPDTHFCDIISRKADKNSDGILSEAEIENVRELTVTQPHQKNHPWYGESLSDLHDYRSNDSHDYDGIAIDVTGIAIFKNLEMLRFHNVEPSAIPFERLTKLERFELSSAPPMELDFSGAPGLLQLDVLETKIKGMELSANTGLKKIQILQCSMQDATLDLSHCGKLKEIIIQNTKLGSMGLGRHAELAKITVTDSGLKNMDLTGCENLKNVTLPFNNLTQLDTSHNKQLDYLDLEGNRLTQLDLRQNSKLRQLYINGCGFRTIDSTSLKVSKNCRLSLLVANGLTKCSLFDVSHIKSLKSACASNGVYKKVKIPKGLTLIQMSSSRITELGAKTFQAPKGAKLDHIYLVGGKLKKADINQLNLKGLSVIMAAEIKISTMDLSKCPETRVYVMDPCKITKLILSKKLSRERKSFFKEEAKKAGAKIAYQ